MEDYLCKSIHGQDDTVDVFKDEIKFCANQSRELRDSVEDGRRDLPSEFSDNLNGRGSGDEGLCRRK